MLALCNHNSSYNMIRPLVFRPLRFTAKFSSAGQIYTFPLEMTPIVNGDTVTVFEVIKIYINGFPNNVTTIVSTKPWANGTPQNTTNILFLYDANSNTFPTSTRTYDFSDGRGNGLLIGCDILYFGFSCSMTIQTDLFCNVLTRQRDISMTEYIQLRESFSL